MQASAEAPEPRRKKGKPTAQSNQECSAADAPQEWLKAAHAVVQGVLAVAADAARLLQWDCHHPAAVATFALAGKLLTWAAELCNANSGDNQSRRNRQHLHDPDIGSVCRQNSIMRISEVQILRIVEVHAEHVGDAPKKKPSEGAEFSFDCETSPHPLSQLLCETAQRPCPLSKQLSVCTSLMNLILAYCCS